MKFNLFYFFCVFLFLVHCNQSEPLISVGKYNTFETEIENNTAYKNKFIDVELTAEFISPSGKTTTFYGFFDGDGSGGGDSISGNIWKIRFMPNELGEWTYSWNWS